MAARERKFGERCSAMLDHRHQSEVPPRGYGEQQGVTMREIIDRVRSWQAAGEHVAIATVLTTAGSTPRPVGAKMAVTASGKIVGSISGGCVDTDVLEHAVEVLRTGRPEIIEYGYSPNMSWEIGLMCGGTVQVFVEPAGAAPAAVDATWLDVLSQQAGDPACAP
jgi:xanthine/CO dehydrogenase XdhC/CoxF family maturation factor